MTASTHPSSNPNRPTPLKMTSGDGVDERYGLCVSHEYSLLSAYEIYYDGKTYEVISKETRAKLRETKQRADVNGRKIIRLVKLRNPWGKGEWTGEFSDKSSIWNEHPELRK